MNVQHLLQKEAKQMFLFVFMTEEMVSEKLDQL